MFPEPLYILHSVDLRRSCYTAASIRTGIITPLRRTIRVVLEPAILWLTGIRFISSHFTGAGVFRRYSVREAKSVCLGVDVGIGRSKDWPIERARALPGRERLGTIGAFEGFGDGEDGDDSGGGGGEKKEFAAAAGKGRAGAERLDDGGAGAVAVEVVIGAFLG
jgi:hypothetical protein